jgi:hypothetical protein
MSIGMKIAVFWVVAPCSLVETSTRLHGATTQKTTIFILTAVRTSNLTEYRNATRHDAERRNTYCRDADFNSKSSEGHRDAIGHDTHKPTPSVETPTKDSVFSVHELSEGTRQDVRKSMPSVAMSRRDVDSRFHILCTWAWEATRHDDGYPTPNVATHIDGTPTQDPIFANMNCQ